MKTCKVRGCSSPVKARGYCSKHYWQITNKGEILEETDKDPSCIEEKENHYEIIIKDRDMNEVGRALVSKNKIDLVKDKRWHLNDEGYAVSNRVRMHRLIMDAPPNKCVDHRNGKRLDNRDENLRLCKKSQNSYNQKTRKDSTTGVKGVSWDKTHKRFVAYIHHNKKRITLGYFKDLEEAKEERLKAEKKYFKKWRRA